MKTVSRTHLTTPACTDPFRGARRRSGYRLGAARAQRGVALVISLILLVVITLVGFAAVRGTIVQQKMASNLYDREVAFQSTEAAMRAAVDQISGSPGIIAQNCQLGGVTCLANPFDDPALAGNIQTVVAGTGNGQFQVGSVAASQPQFIVESMGNWVNPTTSTGVGQTANSKQYGAQGNTTTATYYRITARSGDPATVGNRAVVTLQAMVKN